MTKNLKISAPAKLILFGEYAVLKGSLCIVAAINKKGYAEIRNGTGTITCTDINGRECNMKEITGEILPKNDISIFLNLRFGCGLGSSAVISVLLSSGKYLSEKYDLNKENFISQNITEENKCNKAFEIEEKEVFENSIFIENIFHGKSSGVDVAACFYGGLLCFKDKEIEKVDSKYLKRYKILIFDSKITRNVANVVKKCPVNINKDLILEEMSQISDKAARIISREFLLPEIYPLIRRNQELLEILGACPESMKNELLKIRKRGVEGKITGAGHGGHLFTIVENNISFEGWEEVKIVDDGVQFSNSCE
ncbi:hypothetical protein CWI38_1273p0010 [Hamiltosporidium tvaerminnensis]|uniref:GHMP kinase N-terminal domain-containing protein n=2 Tax=Hamiltosporidium TaxID=1176354 RepID=A0A4Q9KYI1_9MICR|nr:hypothetical protein LUQ84_000226 [Hamiltosporidium tvaerminnensis]TBT98572.1 hypothetical protein CWI37_1693p0010 [Hamiltosporidium tvaerminnensis]TBT99735.1 hypothetical protein CWI36_1867p0010 [Hamiltosporidium magnivora]TBU00070.1 hypothetical protein CWI39_1798p0010 [Hamiltosporidium magnivora]TBU11309.1 hypothetical protein CWI38_1273p0010 [Hamiltosporidium tvaerminnensis]